MILVVGGAGYIGSHMVKLLLAQGREVCTLDNLSTGFRDAVLGGEFHQIDLADASAVDSLLASHRFDAVMHFASSIVVGESVKDPAKYYRNNVVNTLNLLEAMVRHKIGRFIFSSTAAIFGEPQRVPIDEDHPKQPVNPYGASKWMIERVLADFGHAYGLKSVCLRYFNACGADPEGRIGERHDPETHLIPLLLQVASGRRPNISVFGRDYPTPDGTCIRDYIHIEDLCTAHLLAVDHLVAGGDSRAFNLGNGTGFSVQQVLETVRRVTGHSIPVNDGPRREGDPARLVADSARVRQAFGWTPRYADLDLIVRHAWAWEQKCAGMPLHR